MALSEHLPDQRRELRPAQEVAGEEEGCLGAVPGQGLQDGGAPSANSWPVNTNAIRRVDLEPRTTAPSW